MIFFNEKKNQKDSDDFWHRKLTLKVKFWYFLTAPHYSNFQNLGISFEYSWFLAETLSNFVSLPWKLHNRECHSGQLEDMNMITWKLVNNLHKIDPKLILNRREIEFLTQCAVAVHIVAASACWRRGAHMRKLHNGIKTTLKSQLNL